MKTFFAALAEADRTFSKIFQWERTGKFLRKNRYLLVYLLVFAVIAYAYEIFHYSFTMDEETHALLRSAHPGWISQRRWGMYTLSFLLFPNPVIPFVPTLVAVSFTALASFLITHLLSPKNSWEGYLAAPVFIACPVYYYCFMFSLLGYGIGIGLFLSSAAVCLFVSKRCAGRLGALCLMTFCIGIYQAFAVWAAVLFCLYLVAGIIRECDKRPGDYLKEAASFIVLMLLSILCFYVVSEVFFHVFNLQESWYPASIYQTMQWNLSHFRIVFTTLSRAIPQFYLGSEMAYGAPIAGLMYAFPLWLMLTVFMLLRGRQSTAVKVLGLVFLGIALAAPFSLTIMSGERLQIRTHLAIPLVFSALVLFASSVRGGFVRYLLIISSIYCVFQFVVLNHRLAFSNDLTWHADRDFALRLQKSIDDMTVQLAPRGKGHFKAVDIVGRHQRLRHHPLILPGFPGGPEFLEAQGGGSFFEWQQNDPGRILRFMQLLMVEPYKPANLKQRRLLMDASVGMPSWPSPDSLKIVDDILIIKLSDYTPLQLELLCEGSEKRSTVCEQREQSSLPGS